MMTDNEKYSSGYCIDSLYVGWIVFGVSISSWRLAELSGM